MIKIKDLNKVNDKRSKSRRRKKNPPTKEEKTIRITKQTDFVQRDEFHGAEEPMPNVTFREIKRQKKAAQKAAEREQEEQLRKEAEEAEESRSRIELTNTEDKAEVEKPEKADESKITVSGGENKEQVSESKEEKSEHKSRKEKNKKLYKKIAAIAVVVAFGVGVYASRGVWVPKLEGILDRPHATIVNDGKKQSGNFPLTFDESSVNVIKQLSDGIVRVDDRNIAFYDESGNKISDNSHNFANPVVRTSGKRVLVYDNGGNSFRVLNKKGELLSKDIDQSILLAEIAPDSTVAVVTQTEKYAAVLTVYDSSGAEIYQWSSSRRILDISFDKDGSGCCISTFSSSGGALRSVVYYVTFDSTKEKMKSEQLETLAVAVQRNDNGDYWVVGDTCFYKLDSNGKILMQYEYPEELSDYALTDTTAAVAFDGIQRKTGTLAVFRSDSDGDKPDSVVYTQSGKPKKMTAENKKVILLGEDNIEAYDSAGNLLATAAVSSEYLDFVYLNDSVYFLGLHEINKIAFET